MRSAALNAVQSMFAPGANECAICRTVAAPSAAARSRRNGTMRAIAHRRADRRLTASVDIRPQHDRAAGAWTVWPAAAAKLGRQRTAAAAGHLVQRLLWPALVDRAAAPRRLALRDVPSAGASGAGEGGDRRPVTARSDEHHELPKIVLGQQATEEKACIL